MASAVEKLLRPDWRTLEEYKPVKPLDILAAELGLSSVNDVIKLDANENLYGPIDAVRTAVAAADHHIYPDPGHVKLRAALATHTGFRPEEIVRSTLCLAASHGCWLGRKNSDRSKVGEGKI
jgi:histidinol-phosphate aminotransferase